MIIKDIIARIVSIISIFVKPNRTISFCSYPDFTDNPYAVFIKIFGDNRFKDYQFVWMLNSKDKYLTTKRKINKLYPHTKVVKKASFEGFIILLKSRYHICSHGLNRNIYFLQKKPKIINLWHGMPVKVIGTLDPVYGATYENSDIVLATNDFFQDVMARAFLLDKAKVKIFGHPRNDLFIEKTDFFDIYGIKKSDYNSIGAWLPTFHKNIYTEKRIDGIYKEGKIEFFDIDKLYLLDDVLIKQRNLLVIKLHPMDAANHFIFPQFRNIIVVNSQSPTFQLYPFLGKCDYLLTDFSSVFIDFDILSRPMGFVVEDFTAYKKTRGFIVDNVEDFLPGDIISSFDEFVGFINNFRDKAIDTGTKFNRYKDFNASNRVIDYLYSQL